nr:DUF5682 family protein [Streptomyces arboris]
MLRGRHATERAEGGPTAAQVVRGLTEAAECRLAALADERLTELAAVLPASGPLPELLAGLGRPRRPRSPTRRKPPVSPLRKRILAGTTATALLAGGGTLTLSLREAPPRRLRAAGLARTGRTR